MKNNKINVNCEGYDWLWSRFVLSSYTGTCLQNSQSLGCEFTCIYTCQILIRSTNHLVIFCIFMTTFTVFLSSFFPVVKIFSP
jgi:hypothetical protein